MEDINHILKELQKLTDSTMDRLGEMTEEEFEALAEEREELVNRLQPLRTFITDEDRLRISEILKFDQIILKRMQVLKDEAGRWMHNQGKIRVQQNAYQHAYASESFFVDHRK